MGNINSNSNLNANVNVNKLVASLKESFPTNDKLKSAMDDFIRSQKEDSFDLLPDHITDWVALVTIVCILALIT